MNLDFAGAATSTVIRYRVTDVDTMIQREGQRFVFQPQVARIMISAGDGFQLQIEGPRKLARGILSPVQRVTERFTPADLRPDNGIPLWALDLAEFWQDVVRKGTLHQEIEAEKEMAA